MSFEVSVELRNKETNKKYGPVEVFSKLKTLKWPGATLRRRVLTELQPYLAKDAGILDAVLARSMANAASFDRAATPAKPAMPLPPSSSEEAPASTQSQQEEGG